ncbi:hypothetical protein BDB00DRAFT_130722 [Zychaea mexicana]|uniref:uncharacterized protein n=1 Tax=Zychaea mexicana TaxID=64656 RepID=UPI0022FDF479|nr:uncharacterized protein BDB00DRAFT_130722 [Zychaea mexicana]KAI9484571.1 hypothetical protein BDB00DRAFT_130722 [Zychaea mexicana]
MDRYWLFALFFLCFVYAVNAKSDSLPLPERSSSVMFSTIDHPHQHHQQVYSSDVDEGDDLAHVTLWARMFFSPPWLTNTTLLWVTGVISMIVWCSGYTIECLLDRQERLSIESGKQKQQALLYGALQA